MKAWTSKTSLKAMDPMNLLRLRLPPLHCSLESLQLTGTDRLVRVDLIEHTPLRIVGNSELAQKRVVGSENASELRRVRFPEADLGTARRVWIHRTQHPGIAQR